MALIKKHQSWLRTLIAVWCVYTMIVIALMMWSHLDTDTGAEGHGSSYVRLSHDNIGVIIFVHGVLGDCISTWTNPDTKAYWPDLLTKDPTFDHYDIFVYEFPSPPEGTSLEIDELADDMKRVLENAEVLGQKELIFLSHSMGGLVTRALLLKYRELIHKVGFIYFFSTPTTGSQLAKLGELSKNPQFHDMFPMGENAYIDTQQSSWLAAKLNSNLRSFCAYEKLDTYGIRIVDRQSATNLCTESLGPIQADHVSIVKPRDETSAAYIAFRNAFVETHASKERVAQ